MKAGLGRSRRPVRRFALIAIILIWAFLISGALCAQEEKADTAASTASEQTAVPQKETAPSAGASETKGDTIAPAPSEQAISNESPSAASQPQGAAAAAEEAGKAAEEPSIEPGNVTVNFKGADIKTVLAYISEVAGVDIVPAPDVKCEVDLKLTNKPWKTALDIIVRNYGFAYEREGDIIRVVTLNKLKQEELTTQAFSLNYSKAKEVVAAIKDIVGDRGKVMYDERTNTVLATDIPTNIYKIGQIVARLDKMTEQVLIEALVIETVLGDSERMGIDWTAKITAAGAKRPTTFPFDYYQVDNNALNKYMPLVQTGAQTTQYIPASNSFITTPAANYPAGADAPDGQKSKAFPFVDYTQEIFKDTFIFGTLDFSEFKAVLEMIKLRADAEVVANPRIMTLNNNAANIHVGVTVFLPTFERNSTTGKMEITGYQYVETKIDEKTGAETNVGLKSGVNLSVTPHINDKGEIIIDLEPAISDDIQFKSIDPQGNIVAPSINERRAKTQARVSDGDTLFIGGLIHETDEVVNNKLPILGDMMGDVPYLGLLVSHKSTKKVKKELIFFVTVNIVKPGMKIKESPTPEKAPKADFTMTQNLAKGAKPSKKKPWSINNLNFFQ